ncbi:MAG: hypothetical protein AAFZ07_07900 [Actinomycetota bacterium]
MPTPTPNARRIAALVAAILAVVLLTACGGAADGPEESGAISVQALRFSRQGAQTSYLGGVPYRIEPVDGDGATIVDTTHSTAAVSRHDLAAGDYWVTIDRTELGGQPCIGGDRILARVEPGAGVDVAAHARDESIDPFDGPACMTVTPRSSADHVGPCVMDVRDDPFDSPCAEDFGLRSADVVIVEPYEPGE